MAPNAGSLPLYDVRIFPRILPRPVSAIFWGVVLLAALLLFHAPVGRWFNDVVEAKAVVIVLVLVGGGAVRLVRRVAARDGSESEPELRDGISGARRDAGGGPQDEGSGR